MTDNSKKHISKSHYVVGLRCPKLLWFEVNSPSTVPQDTAVDRIRMDDGLLVGAKARELYPDGIKIERALAPEVMHGRSMEALKLRKPLFEAGFIHKHGYALADILLPAGKDEWALYEVKASTLIDNKYINSYLSGRVNYFLADVAFQKYVYIGAGLKLNSFSIMHLNREYVYDGSELLLSELIKPAEELDKDMMDKIRSGIDAHFQQVEKNIEYLISVLNEKPPPAIKLGRYCKGCKLERYCENDLGLPAKGNVMRLRMDREGLRFEMLDKKIFKIADIPITPEIKDPKLTQIEAHRDDAPKKKIKLLAGFLKRIKYPAYFLDFETISSAVPLYSNTHSYQQVPFQYSLHIVRKKGDKPEHYSYLSPGNTDPRPEIISRLKKLLGSAGSILAYNMAFERDRIREASLGNPEYEDWFINNIEGRFIDLEEPFDKFYYYDPRQEGSTSIKEVAPTLTGREPYKGLGIAEGGDAMKRYMDVTFKDVGEDERAKVRADLEKYCEQDTLTMVEILAALTKEAAGA
jgi:Domain of unknown function(DUF2779)